MVSQGLCAKIENIWLTNWLTFPTNVDLKELNHEKHFKLFLFVCLFWEAHFYASNAISNDLDRRHPLFVSGTSERRLQKQTQAALLKQICLLKTLKRPPANCALLTIQCQLSLAGTETL